MEIKINAVWETTTRHDNWFTTPKQLNFLLTVIYPFMQHFINSTQIM